VQSVDKLGMVGDIGSVGRATRRFGTRLRDRRVALPVRQRARCWRPWERRPSTTRCGIHSMSHGACCSLDRAVRRGRCRCANSGRASLQHGQLNRGELDRRWHGWNGGADETGGPARRLAASRGRLLARLTSGAHASKAWDRGGVRRLSCDPGSICRRRHGSGFRWSSPATMTGTATPPASGSPSRTGRPNIRGTQTSPPLGRRETFRAATTLRPSDASSGGASPPCGCEPHRGATRTRRTTAPSAPAGHGGVK